MQQAIVKTPHGTVPQDMPSTPKNSAAALQFIWDAAKAATQQLEHQGIPWLQDRNLREAAHSAWATDYEDAAGPANARRTAHTADAMLQHLTQCAAEPAHWQYSAVQTTPQYVELGIRRATEPLTGHRNALAGFSKADPVLSHRNFLFSFHTGHQMEAELVILLQRIQDVDDPESLHGTALSLAQAMISAYDLYHRVPAEPAPAGFALDTARLWLAKNGFTPNALEAVTNVSAKQWMQDLTATLILSIAGRTPAFPHHAIAFESTQDVREAPLHRGRQNHTCDENEARRHIDRMTQIAYCAFLPAAHSGETQTNQLC